MVLNHAYIESVVITHHDGSKTRINAVDGYDGYWALDGCLEPVRVEDFIASAMRNGWPVEVTPRAFFYASSIAERRAAVS